MNYRIIKRSDYPFLLTIDQKVYPSETPVAPKTLDEWYKNDPDFGIIFDAAQIYFNMLNSDLIVVLIGLKVIFFLIGTYIIVIGSKRTADKLENLTK